MAAQLRRTPTGSVVAVVIAAPTTHDSWTSLGTGYRAWSATFDPGEKVTVRIVGDGQRRNVAVTLGSSAPSRPAAQGGDRLTDHPPPKVRRSLRPACLGFGLTR